MSEESRRKYVSANIEEEDFDAIQAIATQEGKHPIKIVEIAIQEFIQLWAAIHDLPKARIRALLLEDRNRKNTFAMLKQLAYTWNDTKNDDDYNTLVAACELAEVDVDVVLEAINENAQITGIVSTTATGLRGAEMWLEELLSDGIMYPVSKIRDMSEERGFAWHTVTAAKRKRNITSVKDGAAWYWVKPNEIKEFDPASKDF